MVPNSVLTRAARIGAVWCVSTILGCVKLIDKTTYTPTNKEATVPYVATPELELADFSSKLTNGKLRSTHCQPRADGGYDFETIMNGGTASGEKTGTYVFGEGGSCLARGILDVWATSMNQPLMVWDDAGNSGTFELGRPPKGVTRLFDVEYTHVEDGVVPVKVKWNMTWYHTILLGTAQRPQRILINYRRYKGTKFIKYWEGSIILTRITDTVTGIWIRNQIRAAQVTEVNARGGALDIIRKLRDGAPASNYLP